MSITKEQSEQIQEDIIAHLDGIDEGLITVLCQCVCDYQQGMDSIVDDIKLHIVDGLDSLRDKITLETFDEPDADQAIHDLHEIADHLDLMLLG